MGTSDLKRHLLPVLALSVVGLSGCGGDDSTIGPQAVPAGDTFALTTGNRLISFNRAAPGTARTSVAITGLGAGETLIGADFRPADGKLYAVGLTGTTGRILTIDTFSGVATPGATISLTAGGAALALSGTAFGVDFNPVPDRLRIVSDSGQNLRVNVTNGVTVVDTALTGTGAAGVSEVAYTNSFSNACRTTIYYIDTAEDLLLTSASPNAGVTTPIGALGVDASAVSAFDIASVSESSNTAIAVLTVGGSAQLYSINLGTGAATLVGAVGGAVALSEQVRGLAANLPSSLPSVAAGEIYGLTESNKLISFNRAAPGKLCSSASVTGLAAGDTLLGIDFRPANGQLYGLTGTVAGVGRVYTIDTATGAASAPVTLTADPMDASPTPNNDSYTALDGTAFGVDFNPVPDRLRVVSNTGQNLRINVSTGATITDGDISGAAGASAAAYTNSFAGTASTTLYVIDTSTSGADLLYVQNPPNDGTLTSPVSLGLDFTEVNGFDIDGRDNQGLLAASIDPATTSTLYSFVPGVTPSLTLTSLGAIGGNEKLRGLTRPAPVATVFGLTSANALVQLSLAAPGTVTSIGAVTGLAASETLVGIDFRPADGKLYGVGSQSNLYSLDPQTAAATLVAPIATALSGASFGVDFNPAADRLRVVSDTGQNLRIVPDTGATPGDTAHNGADTTGGAAAAYTNSFVSPATTQLLILNSFSDQLQLQSPPNDGTLVDVGPLGVDITAVNGFDIRGGADGLALAAVGVSGGSSSGLYRVNLGTGALTLVGDTGASLGGLAIRLQ